MVNQVKKQVLELVCNDNTGHDMDHIMGVYNLAIKFARMEGANQDIVMLTSLLHDVDDYKMVGIKNEKFLTNTHMIMNKAKIDLEKQKLILEIIKSIGYRKRLNGIKPNTIEGKVVSDADMCDALGSTGIIRSICYAVSDKGNGVIFNRNLYPNSDITAQEYNSLGTTHNTDSAINHLFKKSLKLPNLMMTESGEKEAIKRQQIMIYFLRQLFEEKNAPEWNCYLDNYLEKEKIKKLF